MLAVAEGSIVKSGAEVVLWLASRIEAPDTVRFGDEGTDESQRVGAGK